METMSEALAALDRLLKVLDDQATVNEKMMECVHSLNLLDDQRAGEIAELREGLAALSNRIEAVTRLHSVKA